MHYELKDIQNSIDIQKEVQKYLSSYIPIELIYKNNLYYVYVDKACSMFGFSTDSAIIILRADRAHKPLAYYAGSIMYSHIKDLFCHVLEPRLINLFLVEYKYE